MENLDFLMTKRNYTKNKIGLKGCRSYSSIDRLEYSLRANGLEFQTYIVAKHGKRFVPIFQELHLNSSMIEKMKQRKFAVA